MSPTESNTMTLEQFTDIVLASEGLSLDKRATEKNNNNNYKADNRCQNEASKMVANLMQNNNDLIVEVSTCHDLGKMSSCSHECPLLHQVKPMSSPKPVVLSPRQPPGSHLLPHHLYKGKVSLSSSVVVSVKPRVQQNLLPPQNQPPKVLPSSIEFQRRGRILMSNLIRIDSKIPHLVEEWFSKMQPPITTQNNHETTVTTKSITDRNEASKPSEALNLSVKTATATTTSSKTTQVYLRPISTLPKLSTTGKD